MRINIENMDILRKVYLHDALFAGFTYDYKVRQIRMVCVNHFTRKLHELVFNNVVSSDLQSCCFYGDDNTIIGHSVQKTSPTLDKLYAKKEESTWVYNQSYLGKGAEFIAVEFELISGDTLEIICESVDHTETELSK